MTEIPMSKTEVESFVLRFGIRIWDMSRISRLGIRI